MSGHTLSCGCFKRDALIERQTVDGLSRDARYSILQNAIGRCFDTENPRYANYGGRGITVCDRWRFGEAGRTGAECFCDDMGERPTAGHSLDREDNDGPYSPSNCRWATRTEQQRNTRSNAVFLYSGALRSLVEISELCGINYQTLATRLRRGWSPSRAFSTPANR
ncbi:hypothetical protein [Mesorhizobium onobrychidis]|uniref:HNH endonuclease n=1 Tax=Mesorhizobium onobrychidis TaxID=2775404 RepID=A0ABY5QUM3_9HYPH|nr:hypothetical protein [Mesorhizobium onobrychidis]UVC14733.1 hypothetical protein IHQ72_29650 [Mesorhizobium onobrychidis]